jgi:hypothetical protein
LKSTSRFLGKLYTSSSYLFYEAPINYFWEHAENEPGIPDPFKLQSKITPHESEGTRNRNCMHSSILDRSAFNECIKTLINIQDQMGAIVNEFLRMLPA